MASRLKLAWALKNVKAAWAWAVASFFLITILKTQILSELAAG